MINNQRNYVSEKKALNKLSRPMKTDYKIVKKEIVMEQIMEIVKQLEDTFVNSGEAKNREEAKQMTIELIKKHFYENK